jgi:TolA-binding protein
MKYLISLAILFAAAPLVRAQEVVTDPVSDALNEEMHLEDLAKYVQMVENQVQQIETLTQQLQQTEAYVKAFGDPSQILNVTGANQLVGSLQDNGAGQTMSRLQQLATGASALSAAPGSGSRVP